MICDIINQLFSIIIKLKSDNADEKIYADFLAVQIKRKKLGTHEIRKFLNIAHYKITKRCKMHLRLWENKY